MADLETQQEILDMLTDEINRNLLLITIKIQRIITYAQIKGRSKQEVWIEIIKCLTPTHNKL